MMMKHFQYEIWVGPERERVRSHSGLVMAESGEQVHSRIADFILPFITVEYPCLVIARPSKATEFQPQMDADKHGL